MKAQVLHKYDPEMKEKVWVTEQEMPEPKLEKSSDIKYNKACLDVFVSLLAISLTACLTTNPSKISCLICTSWLIRNIL